MSPEQMIQFTFYWNALQVLVVGTLIGAYVTYHGVGFWFNLFWNMKENHRVKMRKIAEDFIP